MKRIIAMMTALVLMLSVVAMGVAAVWGYSQQRANKKHLDTVLLHIRSLRGEE